MANITHYKLLIYGGPDGYMTNRAQFELWDGANIVGYIRFNDPDEVIETDTMDGTVVLMYLPVSMFQNVLDILRNETPLNIYYIQNQHAFFGTTNKEPIGEAE